jgi:hypothetical protein
MSKRFEYHKCGGVLHYYGDTKVCGLCGAKWVNGKPVMVRLADLKKEER